MEIDFDEISFEDRFIFVTHGAVVVNISLNNGCVFNWPSQIRIAAHGAKAFFRHFPVPVPTVQGHVKCLYAVGKTPCS